MSALNTVAVLLIEMGSCHCLQGNLVASFPDASCGTHTEGSVLCCMQSCMKKSTRCRAQTRCLRAAAGCDQHLLHAG